jgi:hypothetical protein
LPLLALESLLLGFDQDFESLEVNVFAEPNLIVILIFEFPPYLSHEGMRVNTIHEFLGLFP